MSSSKINSPSHNLLKHITVQPSTVFTVECIGYEYHYMYIFLKDANSDTALTAIWKYIETRRALGGAHVPLTKAKSRKLGKFDAP